ncbi:MAG: 16S rRNA pseudouridine(516) synthase [Burkholderiales bacterium]|jgi:16S rRNA pseudouridine516 synthase|nr:16S rRNA pseudouridine(516) synthase [Burkholderiales bacterium]
MQLQRLLQSQGFGSRKTCRLRIEAGDVRVNDAPCRDPLAEFDTAGLTFEIDGEIWTYAEHVYLALHNPAGFECTHQSQHHRSVYALLPPPLVRRGVQSVGRLDADTTGLLLFSDDGRFIHAMASPKRRVAKHYRAILKHPFDDMLPKQLLGGVLLSGESAPLAALSAQQIDAHTLALSIDQGKYHQVKRMVAAAGNRVEVLHRAGFGALSLEDDFLPALAPGGCCHLSENHLMLLGYHR